MLLCCINSGAKSGDCVGHGRLLLFLQVRFQLNAKSSERMCGSSGHRSETPHKYILCYLKCSSFKQC